MDRQFSSREFCDGLGERLVSAFSGAGRATTPGLVGSAREVAVRRELQAALQAGLAVGTGCVIDSYGGTSKQTDIIIYERDLCPVFLVAEAPDAGYFPCEGVMAVGEVKSSLDNVGLSDIFEKIRSVKKLRRRAEPEQSLLGPASVPFRSYGSAISSQGTPDEQFDQSHNERDQIYGFALVGSTALVRDTLLTRVVDLASSTLSEETVNSIVLLDEGVVRFMSASTLLRGVAGADSVALATPRSPFRLVLTSLVAATHRGRTVPREKYLSYYAEADQQIPVTAKHSLVPDGTATDL